MAESSLEDTLTKGKIAGMPVWAMGVGLAAVFIGYRYYKNRTAGPTAMPSGGLPSVVEDADGGNNYGLPDGPIGDWLAQNPTHGAYPVGWSPNGLPSPISNVQWARLVADELLARGADPALVSTAIYKYLAGNPLTEQEQAVINRALQLIGMPPEGLIPVAPATPAPKTVYWYEGRNLWALAGGTEKWMETTSQAQANKWAGEFMGSSKHAIGLTKEQWEDKKQAYLAGMS